MSDAYDPTEDGTESDDAPTGALQAASQLAVTPSGSGDYSGVLKQLNAATQRLKDQRSGLTMQQKISALLTGYAQPSAHTGWQSGVANAAANLQAQTLARQKADASRDDLISKYDLMAAHYGAQNQASEARTAELAAAARARATAATDKAAAGTVQVLPAMFPGAPVGAVLKKLGTDGKWTVTNVPVGTPGSEPAPASSGATLNPFPVKYGTGKELAEKYGITGLTPDTNYALNTTGPEAGKTTEVKTQDYLSQYGGATGPSLLAQLPESDRAQVDAIAQGKIAPPTAGTRSPSAQRILALAAASYPGVDFAKNYKTTLDYAPSGKSGQNIVKGGTAIDHAVKLYDSVDALGNVDAGPLSGIINGIKNNVTASNNPAVKDFRVNRDLFAKELEAAIKGTGNSSSLAEFKNWQKELNDADSPAVMKSVIQRGVGLLGERLQNQVQPYNDTIGVNRSFLSWLPAGAQASFMRVNPDYTLTDDDKKYLMQQEVAKRQATPKPASVAPALSSATGGKALPTVTMQQYQAIPQVNKASARAYLKKQGYDISGLN